MAIGYRRGSWVAELREPAFEVALDVLAHERRLTAVLETAACNDPELGYSARVVLPR